MMVGKVDTFLLQVDIDGGLACRGVEGGRSGEPERFVCIQGQLEGMGLGDGADPAG